MIMMMNRNSMKTIFLNVLLFLIIYRCHPVEQKEECETLAFGTFKGHPKSAQAFKEKCQQIQLDYTPQLCQKALEELILHGKRHKLEIDFGPKILNCFTENDLKNFPISSDTIMQ